MSDDTAISVQNVSKVFRLPHERNDSLKSTVINFYKTKRTFEEQQALKDVSFEVKKGEFFGIVGRNGSGKSTLLKILAGIYYPTAGNVHVNGKLTPFIELGVGFNPELTGRENVFLNGSLLGFNRREMNEMYDDIVEFAELERFMDQKLKNYSSGMQVRLAFSIAIRAQGDILVLDEVLAVGDANFQLKCLNYFEELKKNKQTVVLVTHDMDAVEKHCDRAILINDGVLLEDSGPKEIATQYKLINLSNQPERAEAAKLYDKLDIEYVTVNGKAEAVADESDTLNVDIAYRPKSTMKLSTAISITRDDGVHVTYYDSRGTTTAPSKKGKQYKVSCTIEPKQFLKGAYRVDVEIFDDQGVYQNVKVDAARFAISGSNASKAGIIDLQASWSLKELKKP